MENIVPVFIPPLPRLQPPSTANLAAFLQSRRQQNEETFVEIGTGEYLDDETGDLTDDESEQ